MWFPRPQTPAQIEILAPGGSLSPEAIFELLHHPRAVEWKEKVGVLTPSDGSAKATTRLLHVETWVFKTDVNHQNPAKAPLRVKLQPLVMLSLQVELWHREKFWFVMQAADAWWPVSVCPALTTLRRLDTWEEKMHWWSRMLLFGARMSLENNIGLDLNPSNFGFLDPTAEYIYYVDDEYYARHDWFDLGEAAILRVPEHLAATEAEWQRWGKHLHSVLAGECARRQDWQRFLDGIREYPLTAALESRRQALLHGLTATVADLARTPRAPADPLTPPPPQADGARPIYRPAATGLTCVFGDVHSNLPALEAVLREAEKIGVTNYIFLGDVVSYGPFPHECLERIANMTQIVYLRGNHDHTVGTGIPEQGSNRLARELDRWTTQQLTPTEREWLLALPLEYAEADWLCVHGSPLDPQRFYAYVYEMSYKANLTYLEQQGLALCFYGHTHTQFLYRRLSNGADEKRVPTMLPVFQPGERLLLNPGSVGQPRDGDPRAAFALWDRSQNVIHLHRIPYAVEKTVSALKKAGLPEDLIYRLEVGR